MVSVYVLVKYLAIMKYVLDGSGYVEDGRDIFDDDLDAESITQAASKGKGVKRKKAVSDPSAKGNLKYMLSSISSKKKEETQIQDDNMLSEILDEIDETPSCSSSKEPKKAFVPRKQIAQNYLKKFTMKTDSVKEKPPIAPIIDEEEVPKSPLKADRKDAIPETNEPESQHDIDDDFAEDFDMTQMQEIESQFTESENMKAALPEEKREASNVPEEAEDVSYFASDFAQNSLGDDSQPAEVDVPFVISDSEVFFRMY